MSTHTKIKIVKDYSASFFLSWAVKTDMVPPQPWFAKLEFQKLLISF
jgi:hypothetical protein